MVMLLYILTEYPAMTYFYISTTHIIVCQFVFK